MQAFTQFLENVLTLAYLIFLIAAGRIAIIGPLSWFGAFQPKYYRRTLLVPWRAPYRLWVAVKRWWERVFVVGTKATARWTGTLEVWTLTYKPSALFLGKSWAFGLPAWQPLGIDTSRHAIMLAAAGTGKSVHVTTQIALHDGACFVVDPKGAIARVLAPPSNSPVLDPYRIVPGVRRVAWDLFPEIEAFEKRFGLDAVVRFVASACEGIVCTSANEHQKHFPDNARESALFPIILHVYTTETDRSKRNMLYVRELLTRGYVEAEPHGFKFLLEEMQRNMAFDGIIAARAATLAQMGPNEFGAVMSTLRVQTSFYDLPEIRAISTHSDICLQDLKMGALRLFVAAPVSDIHGILSGWFRLLCVTMLHIMESLPGRMKVPCLTVIDEFASLGHISALEAAAPVLRSYGVRLLVIAQDLGMIKKVYGAAAENFIGSAEAIYYFGTAHAETIDYIVKTLGTCTRRESLEGGWWTQTPARMQSVERPLLYADQVRRYFDKNIMVVVRFGARPLRLKPCPYYNSLPVCLYEPDSDFKEAWQRRLTRRFLKRISVWRAERATRRVKRSIVAALNPSRVRALSIGTAVTELQLRQADLFDGGAS